MYAALGAAPWHLAGGSLDDDIDVRVAPAVTIPLPDTAEARDPCGGPPTALVLVNAPKEQGAVTFYIHNDTGATTLLANLKTEYLARTVLTVTDSHGTARAMYLAPEVQAWQLTDLSYGWDLTVGLREV